MDSFVNQSMGMSHGEGSFSPEGHAQRRAGQGQSEAGQSELESCSQRQRSHIKNEFSFVHPENQYECQPLNSSLAGPAGRPLTQLDRVEEEKHEDQEPMAVGREYCQSRQSQKLSPEQQEIIERTKRRSIVDNGELFFFL